uniref:Uncharacterized protein n=1 Tax=Romanomermis culicivorax TaxID=13658 RepID=A0A915J1E5_ROMCU
MERHPKKKKKTIKSDKKQEDRESSNKEKIVALFAFTHIIGITSACINPILYGVFNENFRREFVALLAVAKITNSYSTMKRVLTTRAIRSETAAPKSMIQILAGEDQPDAKPEPHCSISSFVGQKLSGEMIKVCSNSSISEPNNKSDQCPERQSLLDQDQL